MRLRNIIYEGDYRRHLGIIVRLLLTRISKTTNKRKKLETIYEKMLNPVYQN